ncbi:EAL domain-containing protein [Pseudoalteromonas mariniglutinosa]|uniref:EAL domain-containing protein n=1 Tax=Pseudoalteromonas mariniglutinosa TaxID=206042 RepID=UPI00384BCA61
MAMICVVAVSNKAVLRLNLILSCVLALAILGSGLYWLDILLAISLGTHLWQTFTANNWTRIVFSVCAALMFVLLFTAHLLLATPAYLIVFSVLILVTAELFSGVEVADDIAAIATLPAFEEQTQAPLNDLPDRVQLKRVYLHWRNETSASASLVIIRLEGFERVNQHLGRDFGDVLLAQSARRIKQPLQHDNVLSLKDVADDSDKLAHLGGLNFAFICLLHEQQHLHEQLIEQIRNVTLKPFNVANCTIEVKVRASYVDCDTPDTSFDNLISCAYLALDSNPQQDVIAYQSQMMVAQREQQTRLQELAELNFSDQFELYFQPIIRNQDGRIEFLELLLRWQHPKQGILAAHRFIEDIHVAGLAYPVAAYVIERAAELAMALRMENIAYPLSFNLFGPEMFHEEFIELVERLIAEHGLQPGDLIIECPLDIFMDLDEQGKAMVARLNSIGIKVCVDGLGDSPVWLAKLSTLHVEYIKVAPSLTADFSHQGHIRSLISGMVDMHNKNNAKVICEGVETEEQLKFVKTLNAFAAQGYYFSYPLSSVGMVSWIKQWQITQR